MRGKMKVMLWRRRRVEESKIRDAYDTKCSRTVEGEANTRQRSLKHRRKEEQMRGRNRTCNARSNTRYHKDKRSII